MIYLFCLQEWNLKNPKSWYAFNDKTEYVIHIMNLKQDFNHELVLKKVHRIIKFNPKASLKSHIYINTDLRKNGKSNAKETFSSW